jgi:hypothetical protein
LPRIPERIPQLPPDEEPPSALAAFALAPFALLPQWAANRDATDSKHNKLTRDRPLMKVLPRKFAQGAPPGTSARGDRPLSSTIEWAGS